jgi:hypothetical protein
MVNPDKIFGRLGNKMFQYAFLFSYARDHGFDYYFQDEFFFRENKEAVRALFSSDIMPPIDRVAIHVRRGGNPINPDEPDYKDNPFYVDLTKTDYYERAIAMFPNDKFLVFSDDIPWCKEKWGNDNRFAFSTGLSETGDMNAMAACKAHIIANSSFSWWGAWLHPHYPENKVVAPKEWYADGVERTSLPEHYIRI